jgi:hypothetical protein
VNTSLHVPPSRMTLEWRSSNRARKASMVSVGFIENSISFDTALVMYASTSGSYAASNACQQMAPSELDVH